MVESSSVVVLSESMNQQQQLKQHNVTGTDDTSSESDISMTDVREVDEDELVQANNDESNMKKTTNYRTISSSNSTTTNSSGFKTALSTMLSWSGALVWPAMLTLPLLLASPYSFTHYSQIFPSEWYEYNPVEDKNQWPKALGLILGIVAVAIGQISVLIFFGLFKYGYLNDERREPISIQTQGPRRYDFSEGIMTHLAQPEGFGLLVFYLSSTWMFKLMPSSYYSFEGSIQWFNLFGCLVLQDGIQFIMHLLEHSISPTFYQKSHKPHHRFTNPRMFDAFNGSTADTIFMIIIPLYITANVMRTVNVWTYMAFGSMYAGWLTMIHSEYVFIWDPIFRTLGLGTPADHHVHHKVFKYNYGHLFMWFDQIYGTYKHPKQYYTQPRLFNHHV